jgi:peptide/nickel transport system substrate-binding protein
MRTKRIFGGLALALASVTALAACSSSSHSTSPTGTTPSVPGATVLPGSIGSIPTGASGTETAGSITYGLPPGATPNWILPLATAADDSVYNLLDFSYQMWRPMYDAPNGADETLNAALSLANAPVFSNGDKTVTITLKGWKWSNGSVITSKDLEFSILELKAALALSPANWAAYTPGYFPDGLTSMSTPNSNTFVMNLSKAVNPTWLTLDILGSVQVWPSSEWAKTSVNGPIINVTSMTGPAQLKAAEAIDTFLLKQSADVSTYATNPLWQTVYGPYKISAFNSTTGAFTLVPNADYSGPHATVMSDYVGVPFTSNAAEFNAIKAGSLDVGYIPEEDLPQLSQLKGLGYDYFGLPDFGWYDIIYNFKDSTNDWSSIIGQLYFRQVLQHLEDQAGQVKGIFDGAGDPAYGPVPAYPTNPYLPSNASTNPYPFSIADAVSILKAHGWTVVPNGTDYCSNPGPGASQCGAGIAAGTKLALQLLYNPTPPIPAQVDDLASQAKAAGIQIALKSGGSFDGMYGTYNDSAAPANDNKWEMEDFGGETDSTYPTTFGFLNTGGGGQIGDYSNPTADSLINASVSGSNPNAVVSEAEYMTENLPVLWQPVLDYPWTWKSSVSTSQPQAMEVLTQYGVTPEFWYLTK